MNRSHVVARNVVVTLATQLFSWVLTFGVTLYMPKYLKDTGLGIMTLVASYAAIFSVLVALGTSTVLIKEIARDRTRTGELIWTALLTRLVLGLAAFGAGWVGVCLLRYDHALRIYALIGLGTMVLGQLWDVLSCAVAGLEEFPRQSAAVLAERVISSCVLIGLVLFHKPLWMFIASGFISYMVSLSYLVSVLRRHLLPVPRIQWTTTKSLLLAGMPFLMVGIFGAVYGQSDALLLSKISGVAAIGWYSLAKRLGGSTMIIPVALTGTTLPTLTRMYRDDPSGFQRAVQRLFNLMMICVIPFSAVLILAPGQILSLLRYPASYRNSIPVLMLMGAALILWYLSQAVSTTLIASDRQGVFSKITGIAAVASVPLCAACILVTQRVMANGAVGAMFSDALLELFMVVAYIRVLPPGVFDRGAFSVLGRTAIAALPFVLSLYVMSSSRDLIWPSLGLILYPVICYRLRCLCRDDLLMLQQFTRRFSRA
ncbi:MAG: Polysaccharide biosynthesis protein [Chthonomonadaceae bacterium]|nr:Polysaccharide biosynthesis protein [Chthonomonadaceae bacterium]